MRLLLHWSGATESSSHVSAAQRRVRNSDGLTSGSDHIMIELVGLGHCLFWMLRSRSAWHVRRRRRRRCCGEQRQHQCQQRQQRQQRQRLHQQRQLQRPWRLQHCAAGQPSGLLSSTQEHSHHLAAVMLSQQRQPVLLSGHTVLSSHQAQQLRCLQQSSH